MCVIIIASHLLSYTYAGLEPSLLTAHFNLMLRLVCKDASTRALRRTNPLFTALWSSGSISFAGLTFNNTSVSHRGVVVRNQVFLFIYSDLLQIVYSSSVLINHSALDELLSNPLLSRLTILLCRTYVFPFLPPVSTLCSPSIYL